MGDRKLLQIMFRHDGFYFVDDSAETVTHINRRNIDGRTRRRIKNETSRIILAADAERVCFKRRFSGCNRGADLEHV